MRILALFLVLLPGSALAHVGHLGDVAGHNHWVAGAAIGAAVVIGLYGAWKGRKEAKAEEKPAEDEPQEAEA